MRITMVPTDQVGVINGVHVRRWTGITGKGVPVDIYVHCIAVDDLLPCQEFEAELREIHPSEDFKVTRPTEGARR